MPLEEDDIGNRIPKAEVLINPTIIGDDPSIDLVLFATRIEQQDAVIGKCTDDREGARNRIGDQRAIKAEELIVIQGRNLDPSAGWSKI
jgi:hypothetical protein